MMKMSKRGGRKLRRVILAGLTAGGLLVSSAGGAAVNFGAGDQSFSVVAGDFNNDCQLDLATANAASGNVSVLLNTCTAR